METRNRPLPAEYKIIPIYTATKSLDINYRFNYGKHEDASVTVPDSKKN